MKSCIAIENDFQARDEMECGTKKAIYYVSEEVGLIT